MRLSQIYLQSPAEKQYLIHADHHLQAHKIIASIRASFMTSYNILNDYAIK